MTEKYDTKYKINIKTPEIQSDYLIKIQNVSTKDEQNVQHSILALAQMAGEGHMKPGISKLEETGLTRKDKKQLDGLKPEEAVKMPT